MPATPLQDYRQTRTQLDGLIGISQAQDLDQAWVATERLCVDLGFDYAGIGRVIQTPDGVELCLTHATSVFATSFDQYMQKGLNNLDPVAHVMARGVQQTVAVQSLRHAPRVWKPGADAVLDHFSATGRLCRECGGNSRSAPPGRVGMTQLRRLRQERRVRRADRGFPIRRPSASGSGRMRAAPTEAWARFPVSAGPSGS